MRIPVLVAALVAAVTAAAADRPCSPADASAASKAVDRVMAWGQLHKAWQDWGRCDSGETGDVFTDAVLRLAVDWKKPEELAQSMNGDRGYHDFVLAHLKGAGKEDRDAVYSRARKSCPGGLDAFCGEIADAVRSPAPKAGAAPDTIDLTPIQIQPAPKKK